MDNVINLNTKEIKPASKRHNWRIMKKMYLEGNYTLRQIAEFNNASYDLVRHKSIKDKWGKDKEVTEKMVNDAICIKVSIDNIVNAEYILNKIKELAESPTTKDVSKLKALELLGKSIGLFKDNVQIDGNISSHPKLEEVLLKYDIK